MDNSVNTPHPHRKKILWGMTSLFLLIAFGVFLYWLLWGRFHQYTNDAYVSGNLVYVTPQVSSTATSIYVDDTQIVSQGDLLVELDPTDFQIALNLSKAALGTAIRDVAGLFLQSKQAAALVEVAKADFFKTAEDFEKRRLLLDSGSVSTEDFDHAQSALIAAYFSLDAAEQNHFSLLSQIDQTTLQTHPRVQAKIEELKNAWVALSRCTLVAPVHGLVAQRSVQVGQKVNPAEPLVAIIPLDQMWVDANFKEVQIGNMQIGQKAHITSDVYGTKVEYHGNLVGIGGGTGSVFSLLPPQNATGNWIKIVQRVPVRIALDPSEIINHPLRLGLSMDVTIDIHDIGQSAIPSKTSCKPLYKTTIFNTEELGVETIIEQIFKANIPQFDLEMDLP